MTNVSLCYSTVLGVRALRVHLCGFGFFYYFLFYTEAGSTLALLGMLFLHLRGRHVTAGACGVISLFMRQSNVLWVFTAAVGCLLVALRSRREYRRAAERKRAEEAASSNASSAEIQQTAGANTMPYFLDIFLHLTKIALFRLPLHIAAGAGFVGFVVLNKGAITLGHQEYHQTTLHLAMVTYLAVFCFVFCPDAVLGMMITLYQTRVKDRALFKSMLSSATNRFFCLCCVLAVCGYYSVAHPFLLSDNRHLSFYLWRKAFRKQWVGRIYEQWVGLYSPPLVTQVHTTSAVVVALSFGQMEFLGFFFAKQYVCRFAFGTYNTKQRPPSPPQLRLYVLPFLGATGVASCFWALRGWRGAGERASSTPPYLKELVVLVCLMSAVSLIPLPLLEFRYFLVPLLLLTIFLPLGGLKVELAALAGQVGMNLGILALFFLKEFEDVAAWGPGKQRIML